MLSSYDHSRATVYSVNSRIREYRALEGVGRVAMSCASSNGLASGKQLCLMESIRGLSMSTSSVNKGDEGGNGEVMRLVA